MKTIRAIFIWTVLAACALWTMISCTTVVTETTVTDAKSGLTTVTRTKRTAPDSVAYDLAGSVAALYAPPRARIVRQEKSSADMRALLKGWQGRKALCVTERNTFPQRVAKSEFR